MSSPAPSRSPGPSQRGVEIGTAVALLVFGTIVILGSAKAGIGWGAEGPLSGLFPFLVGIAIVASAGGILVQALLSPSPRLFAEWSQLRQVASVVWPTAIYVAAVPYLGLYLPSILLIAGFMMRFGRYGAAASFGLALALAAVIFMTFEWWFLVPLPKGPVEEFLGL
ncbi:MAG: tripartite tricarboxylate transporter TctB family protein [Acetobacteraceae bacterium]